MTTTPEQRAEWARLCRKTWFDYPSDNGDRHIAAISRIALPALCADVERLENEKTRRSEMASNRHEWVEESRMAIAERDAVAKRLGHALIEGNARLVERNAALARVAELESINGLANEAVKSETARATTAEARVATLEAALIDLLENTEKPPDRNCSCHLSPPCNDCIDYGGIRGALKEARAALSSKG